MLHPQANCPVLLSVYPRYVWGHGSHGFCCEGKLRGWGCSKTQLFSVPSESDVVDSGMFEEPKSRITNLSVSNLAIIESASLPNLSPRLTVITGETGAGKSLVTSALSLACGDAATSSSISASSHGPATINLSFELHGSDADVVRGKLLRLSLPVDDPPTQESSSSSSLTLTVERTIRNTSNNKVRSSCSINDSETSLKNLKRIVSPLIARIDANAAATALSKPNSRLRALDRGVSPSTIVSAMVAYKKYQRARKERQQIQRDLAASLPPSFGNMDVSNAEDSETLTHWVDELDTFEERWINFKERIASEIDSSPSLEEDDDSPDASSSSSSSSSSSLLRGARSPLKPVLTLSEVKADLMESTWSTEDNSDGGWEALISLKDSLSDFEKTYVAANEALATLTSKSTFESASSSIERARDFLYDTSTSESSPVYAPTEDAHELLNGIEAALSTCAEQIERKIVNKLESMRPYVTTEEIDVFIVDWKQLARKHGVTPQQLCRSHFGLRSELDGAEENKEKLPIAIGKEAAALKEYQQLCRRLTAEREGVGARLSLSVSERLKELGMEGAEFSVSVRRKEGAAYMKEEDTESRTKSDGLWGGQVSEGLVGVDYVDFLLRNNNKAKNNSNRGASAWGKVEEVASSGERARILLLIETCLPGSIGSSSVVQQDDEEDLETTGLAKPITVLYDEIDSHVGGRAAVAVAKLLSDQGSRANQIISITHNAAIASIADTHVVVEKSERQGEGTGVDVNVVRVEGTQREGEIARMAAGEMLDEEGMAFAKALIREGGAHRLQQQQQQQQQEQTPSK